MIKQVKRIMPPYFLVRIPQEAQRERLEKIGILYYPPEYLYMKRGMQCGEIIGIGSAAHEFFPEAKEGDILICHHFIEGKSMNTKHEKFFLVHSDEDWNYYCVTAFTYNGDRNNTFGIWDGEKIIPSKEYVFFEIDQEPVSDIPAELIYEQTKGMIITNMALEYAANDLVIPKARKKTRSELVKKMDENMIEMKRLARWVPIAPEKATPMLKRLENEQAILSTEVNTVKYEPHILHAFNEKLRTTVHPNLEKGDRIFVLNIATYMQVEFMGVEYIISESKYCVMKDPKSKKELALSELASM